ncbi:MAG: FeoA family protein [Halothiobacillus sp.]
MAFWFNSSILPAEDFPAIKYSSTEFKPSAKTPPQGYSISLATPGTHVVITSLKDAPETLEKRLAAMGIRVGINLEIIQHEGGSIIVRMGTTRLALGVSMAHRLLVAPSESH